MLPTVTQTDAASLSLSLLYASYVTSSEPRRESIATRIHSFSISILICGRKIPDGRYVDVRKPKTFISFRPFEETVFIVHGFNGTARDKHMRYLKDGKCTSANAHHLKV